MLITILELVMSDSWIGSNQNKKDQFEKVLKFLSSNLDEGKYLNTE